MAKPYISGILSNVRVTMNTNNTTNRGFLVAPNTYAPSGTINQAQLRDIEGYYYRRPIAMPAPHVPMRKQPLHHTFADAAMILCPGYSPCAL